MFKLSQRYFQLLYFDFYQFILSIHVWILISSYNFFLSIHPTSSRLNLKFQLLLFEAMKKTLVFIWIVVLIAIASTMLWLLFLIILFFKFSCSKCCVHTALKLHLRWRSFEINLNLYGYFSAWVYALTLHNKKVTYTQTNLQLKAAGLFKYV